MYLNNLLSANIDLEIMPNPNRERTEQKDNNDNPSFIEFQQDSEKILRSSLLAVTPQEGCALLIGSSIELKNKYNPNGFQIQLIWPCCNIWREEISHHIESQIGIGSCPPRQRSKLNSFILDPNEQIWAQKWARSKKLKVLGTAHSHPFGSPIPSKTDLLWSFFPNLMIIINGNDEMRAWWINTPDSMQPLEIPFFSQPTRPMETKFL